MKWATTILYPFW